MAGIIITPISHMRKMETQRLNRLLKISAGSELKLPTLNSSALESTGRAESLGKVQYLA